MLQRAFLRRFKLTATTKVNEIDMGSQSLKPSVESTAQYIHQVRAIFDPKIKKPFYDPASGGRFFLPVHKDGLNYSAHFDNLNNFQIRMNDRIYLCTRRGGIPVVLKYVLEQAAVKAVQVG